MKARLILSKRELKHILSAMKREGLNDDSNTVVLSLEGRALAEQEHVTCSWHGRAHFPAGRAGIVYISDKATLAGPSLSEWVFGE